MRIPSGLAGFLLRFRFLLLWWSLLVGSFFLLRFFLSVRRLCLFLCFLVVGIIILVVDIIVLVVVDIFTIGR